MSLYLSILDEVCRHPLHEKVTGYDGQHGYVEVFENPTPDELQQVGRRVAWKSGYPDLASLGTYYYYMSGIITPTMWFVWRNIHHKAIYASGIDNVPAGPSAAAIPVYLGYFPETKTLACSIAPYSLTQLKHEAADSVLLPLLQKHPQLRSYHPVINPDIDLQWWMD